MLNNIVWLFYFYYYNFVMKHWRSFFVTLFQGCRTYLLTYWFLFNLIGILGRVWVDPWKVLPFLCFCFQKKKKYWNDVSKKLLQRWCLLYYICLCKYFDVYLLKLIYHVESYLTIKTQETTVNKKQYLKAKNQISMLYGVAIPSLSKNIRL